MENKVKDSNVVPLHNDEEVITYLGTDGNYHTVKAGERVVIEPAPAYLQASK